MKNSGTWAGVILLSITPASLHAQESATSTPPEVFSKVVECRAVTESAARLACYDAAVAALAEAQRSNDVVVVSREDVREARRGLFGLSLPKIRLFGGGRDDEEDDEEFQELTSTIASFREGPRGLIFTLPDGAVWEQTDNIQIGGMREGQTVSIKRGALGSYLAKVGTSRAARVKRIR